MKKLIPFLFFVIITTASQAQFIYGETKDDLGNFLPNICGYVEYENCNGIVQDPLCSNSGGGFTYQLTVCDIFTDTIEVGLYFTCLDHPEVVISNFFTYIWGNGEYVPMEPICISAFSSCDAVLSITPLVDQGTHEITANVSGGIDPYIYEWEIDGVATSLNGNIITESFSSGPHEICVVATADNDVVCSACETFVVFANDECFVDFDVINYESGIPYMEATASGTAPFSHEWLVDNESVGTGTNFNMGGFADGIYNVCVNTIDDNGNGCQSCDEVIVELADIADCEVYFDILGDQNATGLLAYPNGDNFTYEWYNTQTLVATTDTNYLDLLTTFPLGSGVYMCVDVINNNTGGSCNYCDFVQLPCGVEIITSTSPDGETLATANIQSGGIFPYIEWYLDGEWIDDNGNVGTVNLSNYAIGIHDICVSISGQDGDQCDACKEIVVGDFPECLEWSIMDMDIACDEIYAPVCGCDGITYENSCMAFHIYGITEWTDGICDYSEGGIGTGENTNGVSLDCDITADFSYQVIRNDNGDYEATFLASSMMAESYSWNINGNNYDTVLATHTFFADDSLQSHTICLEAMIDMADCVATFCETIILDETAPGILAGKIVQGENLPGSDDIVLITSPTGNTLPDILVEIQDLEGNAIQSMMTDSDGGYRFNTLQFGDYTIYVNIPDLIHIPHPIRLSPMSQADENIHFEVNENGVDIHEVSFAEKINIHPNPTNGIAILTLDVLKNTNISLSIHNFLGQEIKAYNYALIERNHQIILDLKGMNNGIYLLSIQSGNEIYTTKIIKND
ncbi:MAG: hypothetical protein ACI94Y_000116 [Maribacter sp.]|jgi:hypothetical protein